MRDIGEGPIRRAAIGFEAVKVALRQTKDGVSITLAVHPNDGTNDLFVHPVGSRYQVALVLLDDQDQPVTPQSKTDGERAVTAAGMLAKESAFINWLFQKGRIMHPSEVDAQQYIYHRCNIQSRKELADNLEARRIFDGIRLEFSQRT